MAGIALSDNDICEDLIPSLTESEGWTALKVTDGVEIMVRPWRHMLFLRTDASLSANFDVCSLSALDERLSTQRDPISQSKIKVHSVNNPGDAIVSVDYSTEVQKLKLREAALFGKRFASSEAKQCNSALFRCIRTSQDGVRIDVTAPVSSQTGLTMSLDGSAPLWLCSTRPNGPGKFAISMAVAMHQRKLPVWLQKNLLDFAEAVAKHKQYYLDKISQSCNLRELYTTVDFYLLLTLKSCNRGFPLLPCTAGASSSEFMGFMVTASVVLDGEHWVQLAPQDLDFPQFLEMFLLAIGIRDFDVFDSMYGRRLMAWQAVVARNAWHAIRAQFEMHWKTGRAAYRRLFGGKAAPCVTEDAEPKFGSLSLKRKDRMGVSRASGPMYVYRTRNTFVDSFHHVGDELSASESDSEATLSC